MPTTDQLGPSMVLGIMVMYFQRWLKRFDWYASLVEKFPMTDKRVHQLFAGLVSFAAAVGVVYTMAGDAATGWHLTIDIPSLHALTQAIWNWVATYFMQSYAYDSTRRPADAVPYPATSRTAKKALSPGGKG